MSRNPAEHSSTDAFLSAPLTLSFFGIVMFSRCSILTSPSSIMAKHPTGGEDDERLPESIEEALENARAAFAEEFGREPGTSDSV